MTESQKSTTLKGSIAIGFSAILWGLDGVIFTPQLSNLDVGFVVFILHLFPFLLMNIFFAKQYRNLLLMNKSDIITFFFISLFGGALGTLSIVKALFLLNFNHLSIVALLQKLQPIFAIFLAWLLLKEKISKNFAIWALIAVISSYFLTFGWNLPNTSSEGINTVYAALLSLLAAFSFGCSTVLSKKILGSYTFVTSTFFRYGFTTFIMFLYMIFWGKFSDFAHVTERNWFFIIIIGLTTGSGAIFLYYYGLRKVKAMLSSIIELLFPISAIVLDYFINGTTFSAVQWIAAAVMIFSIVKLNAKPTE